MIGSGQPTLRRVASSSTTIMIVPMIQSSRIGIADAELRDRGRPTARRGWRRRPRSQQSPVDELDAERAQEDWTGGTPVAVLRPGENEKDQPEHEGEMDAAMESSPAAGRSRPCSSGSTTARTAAPPTIHRPRLHSGRKRISGSSSSSSFSSLLADCSGTCAVSICLALQTPPNGRRLLHATWRRLRVT